MGAMTPPAPPPILRYFATGHLPVPLAAVAVRFRDLAEWVAGELPAGAEQSTALRKLLEAKDAAVRAALPTDDLAALLDDWRAQR